MSRIEVGEVKTLSEHMAKAPRQSPGYVPGKRGILARLLGSAPGAKDNRHQRRQMWKASGRRWTDFLKSGGK